MRSSIEIKNEKNRDGFDFKIFQFLTLCIIGGALVFYWNSYVRNFFDFQETYATDYVIERAKVDNVDQAIESDIANYTMLDEKSPKENFDSVDIENHPEIQKYLDEKYPDDPNEPKKKLIIISAMFRSGSSFMGSLFGTGPKWTVIGQSGRLEGVKLNGHRRGFGGSGPPRAALLTTIFHDRSLMLKT